MSTKQFTIYHVYWWGTLVVYEQKMYQNRTVGHAGEETEYWKGPARLRTKTWCTHTHTCYVFSLFMKFGDPRKGWRGSFPQDTPTWIRPVTPPVYHVQCHISGVRRLII